MKRWGLREDVNLRSIGKGFIIFNFENEDDMVAIWRKSLIRVDGQLLRFQPWRKDFTTQEQVITHRLQWIRLPHLPQEYWHEEILLSIAKAVGRPITIDKRTRDSFYGHFARVCVDVDESIPRVEEVYVEREQEGTSDLFVFKQPVIYEDPPTRCPVCHKFGHRREACPDQNLENTEETGVPGANYVDQAVADHKNHRRSRRRRRSSEQGMKVNNGAQICGENLSDVQAPNLEKAHLEESPWAVIHVSPSHAFSNAMQHVETAKCTDILGQSNSELEKDSNPLLVSRVGDSLSINIGEGRIPGDVSGEPLSGEVAASSNNSISSIANRRGEGGSSTLVSCYDQGRTAVVTHANLDREQPVEGAPFQRVTSRRNSREKHILQENIVTGSRRRLQGMQEVSLVEGILREAEGEGTSAGGHTLSSSPLLCSASSGT
ncbi:uncharacterized protein LOC122668422 [Telopea speciosissima]|uniref:uncharacterized protein LOC122668422 n=1 Tax=Telopea speciosissima TaxID=54955 RepID=UPI001CC38B86|nr:uncharacterized protein LOC122668422 [Telopea speciosissima]